jgi:tRNA(Phe) wybutosine-synthesizing methylase Tyw3
VGSVALQLIEFGMVCGWEYNGIIGNNCEETYIFDILEEKSIKTDVGHP